MTDQTPGPAPRRRRWIGPLLFVSLALNLLVVGAIAGMILTGGPDKRGRSDGPARSLLGAPFVRALEPADRLALGQEMLSNRDQLRENRADLRRRVEALIATLRQETFDRQAVSALLAEQRDLAVTRQEYGEVLLLNRLEGMSLDERRAYADRLGESFRGFRRK